MVRSPIIGGTLHTLRLLTLLLMLMSCTRYNGAITVQNDFSIDGICVVIGKNVSEITDVSSSPMGIVVPYKSQYNFSNLTNSTYLIAMSLIDKTSMTDPNHCVLNKKKYATYPIALVNKNSTLIQPQSNDLISSEK